MWDKADRETYKDDGRRYPSDLTDDEGGAARATGVGLRPADGGPARVGQCLPVGLPRFGYCWRTPTRLSAEP